MLALVTANLIVELSQRASIDPDDAAAVLGLPILAVEQVSAFRREYQLGANELFADATAIVGGHDDSWRVLDLVPRELPFAPLLARLPDRLHYEQRPIYKHTHDGPMLVGMQHHLFVAAGTLVVSTRNSRVERIALSTDVARALQARAACVPYWSS